MINILISVVCVVIIGILYCIYKCRKSGTKVAESISRLLFIALVTVISYLVFGFSDNNMIAYIFATIYCCSIDWVLIGLFDFTGIYTEYSFLNKRIKGILYIIAAIDNALLLLNIPFHNVFLVEKKYFFQSDFNSISDFGVVFYMHLGFSYIIVIAIMAVMVRKIMTVPEFYRKKYSIVLSTFLTVIFLNAIFVCTDLSFDISIPFYMIVAVFISYYAVSFMPNGLVEKTLSLVVDDMNSGIICFDFQGKCIYANELARDLFETGDDIKIFEKYLPIWLERRHIEGESASTWTEGHLYKDEEIYIKAEFKKILDENSRLIGYYFCMSDRTNEIEKYRSAVYRANHDNLTGIYTREKFFDKVSEIIHINPEVKRLIICTRINNFQMINDLFGIEMGDEVLKQQADILKEKIRADYVYGRLIGDRFAMCVPKELFDMDNFIKKNTEIGKKYHNKLFGVYINIGIYEITDIDEPVSDMCDKAYIAIDGIKESNDCNVAYFDDDILDEVNYEKGLVNDFEMAIEQGQFKIKLQPRVSGDGTVKGAEALVRWEHPEKGMIMPGDFIRVFEKRGLIYRLDGWVWEQAVIQLKKWKEKGREDLYLSINISAKDFFYLDVYKMLTGFIKEYDVNPANLRLEIKENVLVTEVEGKLNVLSSLSKFGFKIEMDDFGSGYSSLNILKSMNVDNVKFDIKFIKENIHDEKNVAVLDATALLTKNLGKGLIIEGVETKEEVDTLIKHGCGMFQGYYFSKPLSVEKFEDKFLQDVN